MILLDASVWIDFFNGRSTPEVERLAQLLTDAAHLSACPTSCCSKYCAA